MTYFEVTVALWLFLSLAVTYAVTIAIILAVSYLPMDKIGDWIKRRFR